ncbi:cell division activator CedA [Citrobacter sp. JGM124]|uniref:cell division activator CedA n=1 Tax=Citrobacter sp. JGM124 TaxID=2799789 RepID=UPI001BA47464|nr:cell division activator CedA [Citrobacter sp. JGM124]MBS0847526.1 cell division activator CedA [Citrobacter sp. JGM124]
MKPLRQASTRPVISYKPRVEPSPPVHAQRLEGYQDVYQIRGQYVAFVLLGDTFKQSPVFAYPESAQRWANQTRQDGEDW